MLIEMINCDSIRARGQKCYVYIAYFSIDLAITNAYIFHCLLSEPSFHKLNDFHLNLATKLISLYNSTIYSLKLEISTVQFAQLLVVKERI